MAKEEEEEEGDGQEGHDEGHDEAEEEGGDEMEGVEHEGDSRYEEEQSRV